MGWYNTGDWSGLDGANIQNALVSLCNAVNERWDALGLSRFSWATNSGAKSANLVASDFTGLDLHRTNYYQQVFDQINGMIGIGFAKTSTNTAKGADLWTLSSMADDITIEAPSSITNIFDKTTADFLRQALDRLVYPRIFPTNDLSGIDQDIGPGVRTYWKDSRANAPTTYTSAGSAWSAMDFDGVRDTLHFHAMSNVFAQWHESSEEVRYISRAFLRSVLQVAPRLNGLGNIVQGYNGTVTKAWLALRYSTATLSGEIGGTFFGAADSVSNTGNDLILRDLDVATSNFSPDGFTHPAIHLDDLPSGLPFSGSRVLDVPGSPTATGEGGCGVYAVFRHEQNGPSLTTITADYYSRFILDISSALTDQA